MASESNGEPKATPDLPRTCAEIDAEIVRRVEELTALRRPRTITARFERDRAALTTQ